jgi:hypothetical protein
LIQLIHAAKKQNKFHDCFILLSQKTKSLPDPLQALSLLEQEVYPDFFYSVTIKLTLELQRIIFALKFG